MSEQPVRRAEDVDERWLQGVLERSGALRSGRVTAIVAQMSGSNWSRIVKLAVEYSPDAEGDCPPRLLVKICAGSHAVFGCSEVEYYRRDYAGDARAPLPRCYAADYDTATRDYSLVLDDLSDTHAGDHPVTRAYALSLGDAVARLHARYWGRERLGTLAQAPAARAEVERYFAHVGQGLTPLFEVLGASSRPEWPEWPEWRAELEGMFARHPGAMLRRSAVDEGMTLVHGDLNPSNILAPRSGAGSVYLIDRQPFDWSLRCWLGASDMAYAMILFWSPDERRRFQEAALAQYQRSLRDAGIDYEWEQLWWDYRFSAAQCAEYAVEWLVLPEDREKRRALWMMQLERSMQACLELESSALW